MTNKTSSILDDLMDIAEMFPWWIGILMAIATYFFFHELSAGSFSITANNQIFDPGIKIAAMFLQYLFPLPLVGGAIASAIKQWKRGNIHSKQTSLNSIRNLSWREFEQLIGAAYEKQGYQVTETDLGPDGGIDLVLKKDGRKIYVQCKHWKKMKVGVKELRELNGVVAANAVYSGVLVTSGIFTTDALSFAETSPIELIDGDKLRRLIPQIKSDTVVYTQEQSSHCCPKCGSTMKKRTAKKGPSAGNSFWGCSTFPACKATLNIE